MSETDKIIEQVTSLIRKLYLGLIGVTFIFLSLTVGKETAFYTMAGREIILFSYLFFLLLDSILITKRFIEVGIPALCDVFSTVGTHVMSLILFPVVNKYKSREQNYEEIIKGLQKQLSVYELSKQKQEIKTDQKEYREEMLMIAREKYPDLVEALTDNSVSSYEASFGESYFAEPKWSDRKLAGYK